jgi:hypothetical protein
VHGAWFVRADRTDHTSVSLLAPAMGEMGAQGAGVAAGLATASAIAGRTLVAWLLPPNADRRDVRARNLGVQIIGCCMFLTAGVSNIPLLLIGVVLFGAGIGNVTSMPPSADRVRQNRSRRCRGGDDRSCAGILCLRAGGVRDDPKGHRGGGDCGGTGLVSHRRLVSLCGGAGVLGRTQLIPKSDRARRGSHINSACAWHRQPDPEPDASASFATFVRVGLARQPASGVMRAPPMSAVCNCAIGALLASFPD